MNNAYFFQIFLAVLFVACTPTKDEAPDVVGDGSGLPMMYWKVELVGKRVRVPSNFDEDNFVRFFDDGRIVTSMENNTVAMRSADGVWKEVLPPPTQEGARITWYEDEKNLGGHYSGAPAHGFALVKGVLHIFYGPNGKIRGWLPDSTLLMDADGSGYRFFLKWKFGPTLVDELDIHDYFYQDFSKSRMFSKLSKDGTFLLIQTPTGDSRPLIMKDGKEIPIGPEQFSITDPLMLDREMIIPCCRITTIDRVRGGILGTKNGKPVIKVGEEYDIVSEEKGQPVALNGKGDVLFTSNDSKRFQSPRIRFKGKLYQFPLTEWTKVSGNNFLSGGTGLPNVIDMNESGQVIFAASPPSPGETGARLYMATPSISPLPPTIPTVFAKMTFTVKSGTGKVLDAIEVNNADWVTGAFSGGNLTLSITAPTAVAGKSRSFFALINASTPSAFTIDMPIPVKTTFLPTGMVTASTSYSDLTKAYTAVAIAGSLRVKSLTATGGFIVAMENIEITGKDGTVYIINGEATVVE